MTLVTLFSLKTMESLKNGFWSDSTVSNENSIAGLIAVVTALTLILGVNGPVNGTKNGTCKRTFTVTCSIKNL